eukprot:CAMPEP_0205822064 /NCGR_PEP_ID=MMETSP0206-20130828/10841_1 /ASSEMBLY_ACC=CAM_ASM_000279 /TAXON_ID=36767 /ORGANISM="Euplotes focardii, Strain TN1" /LENGTH=273 /DNA_ID=CAMNT_0053118017 /DNA_START=167 /DNA_END=988 /DNA_ORIENTATION=+
MLPVTPNNLWDNPGARKRKTVVGRGPGAGKGKTCGRGHNGQKSRPGTGKIRPSFIGGQNPLNKRLPKKGFNRNATREPLNVVNIRNIVYMIKKGRLDPTKTITIKDLFICRALSKITYGVKILGKGAEELNTLGFPIHLEVQDASQTVIDLIKANGGSVTCKYMTPLIIRRLLHPHAFKIPQAKIPMPKPKKVLKLEKLREKGMEVIYPKAPWFEEYKAEQELQLAEFEAREKTPGEQILPQYPADRSKGVSWNKPKIEKQELPKRVVFPVPL